MSAMTILDCKYCSSLQKHKARGVYMEYETIKMACKELKFNICADHSTPKQ
ncbi:hypothetical protein DDB_G0267944 [Dictyostelium discoideum AX4]|uniref:hypothetical protein n=1 Tax=Dictyostelium discoideum AX4 TaxID=352472 RepID=UPI00004E2A31|nr:hypothetical protein DDB_G0267944 [Dictyostelium discoideum AX4]EAL73425.1 hypothetical protein DDB_G0267944 [Dictyostelium discoideum AX4]|eukprot:XP_647437.1 hypothetical protein DDB_G0267944 [Dictyostelium discoideum AX4]